MNPSGRAPLRLLTRGFAADHVPEHRRRHDGAANWLLAWSRCADQRHRSGSTASRGNQMTSRADGNGDGNDGNQPRPETRRQPSTPAATSLTWRLPHLKSGTRADRSLPGPVGLMGALSASCSAAVVAVFDQPDSGGLWSWLWEPNWEPTEPDVKRRLARSGDCRSRSTPHRAMYSVVWGRFESVS